MNVHPPRPGRPRARPPPLIRIVHVNPPQIVRIDVSDFRSTVQCLTGWTNHLSDTLAVQLPSPSSSSSSSSSCCSSPASNHTQLLPCTNESSANHTQINVLHHDKQSSANHIQLLDHAKESSANHTQMFHYDVENSANYPVNQSHTLTYTNESCARFETQSFLLNDPQADCSEPPSPTFSQAALYPTERKTILASPRLEYRAAPDRFESASCSAAASADYHEDDRNHNSDIEGIYLSMMMELGDIEENDQQADGHIPLSFFDAGSDDDDLLHIRLLANLQS